MEKFDEKYFIKQYITSGGTATTYVVIDKKTNEEYVAKIINKEQKLIKCFNDEINILKALKKHKNPYIINIIDSGTGDITFKNEGKEKIKKRDYIILEYAIYGALDEFIDIFNKKGNGLGELDSKILFKKIVEGVKFCHEHNICHRDLKLENILLDKDFTPKICDFGFACENTPNLTDELGTPKFLPPEILSKKKYDGFKVDIYYLGEILISLTTGKPAYNVPDDKKDDLYKHLILRNFKLYWQKFCGQIPGVTLSEEFKNLYEKMLRYYPSTRPNIQEVLQHPWFKEINEMNEEQLENIENKLREKFLEAADKVKNKNQKTEYVTKTNNTGTTSYRSGGEDNIFDLYIKPKVLQYPVNMKYSIKIMGSLNPAKFMNSLCHSINKEFENEDCIIEPDKNKLKFNLISNEEVEEEENENNEEITEELIEELKKLEIEKINNDDENYYELIIQVKLYKITGGYLLKFNHKKGLREKFFTKFEAISDLVKKIIS